MHRPEAPPPTPRALFTGFLGIGVSGFGGVMPWARRLLVEQRRWLTADEFTDLLSLCQFLPGPNIVNVAVAVGARFCGAPGALATLAGLMIAPFAIVLALGALYTSYGHLPDVAAAFRGVAAVAAGLVVALAVKMARAGITRWTALGVAVAAFAAIGLARLPLFAVLGVLAPLSVLLVWRRVT